jgi:hypothetical protein
MPHAGPKRGQAFGTMGESSTEPLRRRGGGERVLRDKATRKIALRGGDGAERGTLEVAAIWLRWSDRGSIRRCEYEEQARR